MASCEKCWRDAGGDASRYVQLLIDREYDPCTPEEQAGGENARMCPQCKRRALHVHVNLCMACGHKPEGSA